MKTRLLQAAIVASLCVALVVPSAAQFAPTVISKGQEVGIIVGVVAIAAVLVFVVYRTTHRHANLTGCVTAQGSGITLQTDSDHRIVPLTGSTSGLNPGQHVRLQGKKRKEAFEVQKLARDLGACRP